MKPIRFTTKQNEAGSAVMMPKKDAVERPEITDEMIETMITLAFRQSDAQSAALIATLGFTGLRAAEVVDLRVDDLVPLQGSMFAPRMTSCICLADLKIYTKFLP